MSGIHYKLYRLYIKASDKPFTSNNYGRMRTVAPPPPSQEELDLEREMEYLVESDEPFGRDRDEVAE